MIPIKMKFVQAGALMGRGKFEVNTKGGEPVIAQAEAEGKQMPIKEQRLVILPSSWKQHRRGDVKKEPQSSATVNSELDPLEHIFLFCFYLGEAVFRGYS